MLQKPKNWLKRIDWNLLSLIFTGVFCIYAGLAMYAIFSTGFVENDAGVMKALETNTRSVIRMQDTTWLSVEEIADILTAPVMNDTPVVSRIIRNDPRSKCEGSITKDLYKYACPLPTKGNVLELSVDRNHVLIPIWRDLRIAVLDTGLGIVLLMILGILSYRRSLHLLLSNRRLQARGRQLEATTFSLVHDIRGPSDSIRFGADMLIENFTEDQRSDLGLTDIVQLIDDGSNQQQTIIRDLSQWLKSGSGSLTLVNIDLDIVFDRLVKENAYLGSVTRTNLPVLQVDPGVIAIAFDNLIKNGLKYNHKLNPFVKVSENGSEIVFEDNGEGFDASDLPRLIQPFQRASNDSEGSGLGLAIVDSILGSHGFVLSAESTPGKGSKFFVKYRGK